MTVRYAESTVSICGMSSLDGLGQRHSLGRKRLMDDSNSDLTLALLAKALRHPTRVRLVRLLAKESRSFGDIVRELSMTQSLVSEHLRVLREAGLVEANRDGPRMHYSLVRDTLQRLQQLARQL